MALAKTRIELCGIVEFVIRNMGVVDFVSVCVIVYDSSPIVPDVHDLCMSGNICICWRCVGVCFCDQS